MELALSVIGRLASCSALSKTRRFSGWIQEESLTLSRTSQAGDIFECYRMPRVARIVCAFPNQLPSGEDPL